MLTGKPCETHALKNVQQRTNCSTQKSSLYTPRRHTTINTQTHTPQRHVNERSQGVVHDPLQTVTFREGRCRSIVAAALSA